MLLIVTSEQYGVDRYSQEIAKRLDVSQITTRRYLSLTQAYRLARLIHSQPDIVHLPNQHFARYALWLNRPFIVTVHDVARLWFSFDRETLRGRLLLKLDRRCIKRASHIIAASHCTKHDLVHYLNIPESRISVIYNGVDHNIFKPRPVSQRRPYILYVGSERRRKNLGRLLQAFARLKTEFPDLKLIKVGDPGRSPEFRNETMATIARLGLRVPQDVIFAGYVSQSALADYYSLAALLAYPSLYEGFGLPPLESMACGCPVVASRMSSLPEVVGDAGILVNPYDTSSLAEGMRRVLTDSELRRDLVIKGLKRARRFSWEETAELTRQVYNKVLTSSKKGRGQRGEINKQSLPPIKGKGEASL